MKRIHSNHPTAACAVVLLAAFFGTAVTGHAAVITWGSTQAVSGTSDVSTNGSLLEAFNLGYSNGGANDYNLADAIVNGVTFTSSVQPAPFTANSSNSYNQLDGGDTGDAGYNALLNSVAFGGGAGLFSINIGNGGIQDGAASGMTGNLVVGTPYEVQLWFVDERGDTDTRTMQFGDGNGNTVDVGNAVTSTLGEYAIGTFTADGATQTLTLDAQGFGNAHFTAYQIRTIPEPSSGVLIGGLIGLALLRRRR